MAQDPSPNLSDPVVAGNFGLSLLQDSTTSALNSPTTHISAETSPDELELSSFPKHVRFSPSPANPEFKEWDDTANASFPASPGTPGTPGSPGSPSSPTTPSSPLTPPTGLSTINALGTSLSSTPLLSERLPFLETFTFESRRCRAVLRDGSSTASNEGFIYLDTSSTPTSVTLDVPGTRVRNDGAASARLSSEYLWDLVVENWSEYSSWRDDARRGYNVSSKRVYPIVSISNASNDCLLTCDHEIDAEVIEIPPEEPDELLALPDVGLADYKLEIRSQRFRVFCGGKTRAQLTRGGNTKNRRNLDLWRVTKLSDGKGYKLQLVDKLDGGRVIKDQILTFGTQVHRKKLVQYALPPAAELTILFDHTTARAKQQNRQKKKLQQKRMNSAKNSKHSQNTKNDRNGKINTSSTRRTRGKSHTSGRNNKQQISNTRRGKRGQSIGSVSASERSEEGMIGMGLKMSRDRSLSSHGAKAGSSGSISARVMSPQHMGRSAARSRSQSFRNSNNLIREREGYRTLYRFDTERCVVMLKDDTLRSMEKTGYIKAVEENENEDEGAGAVGEVRNDGAEDSMFSEAYLWEVEMINYKELKRHKSLRNLHAGARADAMIRGSSGGAGGGKKNKMQQVSPIVTIKNVGTGGYLRSKHEVRVKEKKEGVEDVGTRFEMVCGGIGKGLPLWVVEKEDGLYTMNMVTANSSLLGSSYKLVKNQFLTFGKGIKVDGKKWRLPRKTKMKVFK